MNTRAHQYRGRTSTTLPAINGYTEQRTYDRAGHLTTIAGTKSGTTLSAGYRRSPARRGRGRGGTGRERGGLANLDEPVDVGAALEVAEVEARNGFEFAAPVVRDAHRNAAGRLLEGKRPAVTASHYTRLVVGGHGGQDERRGRTGATPLSVMAAQPAAWYLPRMPVEPSAWVTRMKL
ncbi:hypothetical protein GCM10009665_37730 [Kitasatospora nipponensis]|uniref:YD repeat-containing protein n=1 Tax=Kitasatospora nipponensis TaxID=258049 RepID=A0ABN1WDW7_9ACTN